MKLNTTELGLGESTPALRAATFGKASVVYVGNLSDETLSMEMAVDAPGFNAATATWLPFFPGDDDTLQEEYSNSTPSARARVFQLPGGIWVRWTMSNGAGTPSDVYVLYDGENLKPAASS